jgi:hypothetical protein
MDSQSKAEQIRSDQIRAIERKKCGLEWLHNTNVVQMPSNSSRAVRHLSPILYVWYTDMTASKESLAARYLLCDSLSAASWSRQLMKQWAFSLMPWGREERGGGKITVRGGGGRESEVGGKEEREAK